MAYGLGYAGGYGDVGVEPPAPPPVVGGGAPLYRRRWTTRPVPPQAPVKVRVRIEVVYRWAARVIGISTSVKTPGPGLRSGFQVRAVTVHVAEHKVASRMEVKNVHLAVDPVAQSRHAWELREMNEIAVALAVLEVGER